MANRQVDQLAKFAADWVKAGGKLDIQVLPDTCRKAPPLAESWEGRLAARTLTRAVNPRFGDDGSNPSPPIGLSGPSRNDSPCCILVLSPAGAGAISHPPRRRLLMCDT
jgi:hypothetical protein